MPPQYSDLWASLKLRVCSLCRSKGPEGPCKGDIDIDVDIDIPMDTDIELQVLGRLRNVLQV